MRRLSLAAPAFPTTLFATYKAKASSLPPTTNSNTANDSKKSEETMRYTVWRADTHGNEFDIKRGLSKEEANKVLKELQKYEHHQHYWKTPGQ